MLVTVHQPVYFPWVGTLHKIATSDAFVLYDDCLASRPSWMNRVYIIERGKKKWLTVPVLFSANRKQLVREVRINRTVRWSIKHLKTIHQLYSHAPNWKDVQTLISPLYDVETNLLAEVNTKLLLHTMTLLGIRTPVISSSNLTYNTSASPCDKLAQMVAAVGGTEYFNGMGAGCYFTDAPFREGGIGVRQQRFTEPGYIPFNAPSFLPGMSVIDVIANIGLKGVSTMIGCTPPPDEKKG